MKNWIERYIYAVTRRLPEGEREEVGRELRANIADMLPEDADEEAIKAVLYELGDPAALSEQYRQKPRYLISPASYDEYVRVLKWVLPLVGGVLLAIGLALGAAKAAREGAGGAGFLGYMLSEGMSLGVSGAFQALVWTTVGFVIADRAGAGAKAGGGWKLEDLPEPPANAKGRIPLSDSIVELVFTAVFTALAALFCVGFFPIVFSLQGESVVGTRFFSEAFLAVCLPFVLAGGALGCAECIVKIAMRRWTPAVCAVVVGSNLASTGMLFYLLTRPDILSPDLAAFVQTQEWGSFDLMRLLEQYGNPILILIGVIGAVACLGACIGAVVRTVKAQKAG